MNEAEIPRHTSIDIARSLGISHRWARELCRRVVGKRKIYNLTDSERAEVVSEHLKYKQNSPSFTAKAGKL